MIKNIQKLILFFGLILVFSLPIVTQADSPLGITILSSETLSGTAGDYVTVQAEVSNSNSTPIDNITTYLSLVDTQTKLPVDLEDWSAEKGLFIGSIGSKQVLPLEWKIHFVKPGNYTLTVIADVEGQNQPLASSLTRFTVAPKHNLNPGQVLPVALGTPIILIIIFLLLSYRHSKT